jgi:hypothetical protein
MVASDCPDRTLYGFSEKVPQNKPKNGALTSLERESDTGTENPKYWSEIIHDRREQLHKYTLVRSK